MAEFCETGTDADKCFYIPSRKFTSTASAATECQTQFASSRLAVLDSSETALVNAELNSNADLGEF